MLITSDVQMALLLLIHRKCPVSSISHGKNSLSWYGRIQCNHFQRRSLFCRHGNSLENVNRTHTPPFRVRATLIHIYIQCCGVIVQDTLSSWWCCELFGHLLMAISECTSHYCPDVCGWILALFGLDTSSANSSVKSWRADIGNNLSLFMLPLNGPIITVICKTTARC